MVKATIASGILKAVSALLALGVAIIFARALGAEGFGFYSIAFAISAACTIFVQAGLPSLVTRETAVADADKDYGRMRAVWNWSTRAALLFSFTAVFLGAGIGLLLSDRFSQSELWTLLLAFSLMPVTALGAIRGGALRGLGHVILAQLPEQLIKPGFLLLLGLALGIIIPATPPGAMTIQLAATAVAFVAGAAFLWRMRPLGLRAFSGTVSPNKSAWWLAAASMGMSNGINQLNNYVDTFSIAIIDSITGVGIYRISFLFSMLSLFGLQAISMVVNPSYARLFHKKDIKLLKSYIILTSRFSFLFSASLLLLFIIFGKYAIHILFGLDFESAYVPAIILIFGQTVSCYYGSPGEVLIMTGNETMFLKIRVLTLVINIIMNIVLVPFFSLSGAAIATSGSLIIANLLANQKCKRVLGIDCSAFRSP